MNTYTDRRANKIVKQFLDKYRDYFHQLDNERRRQLKLIEEIRQCKEDKIK